MRRRKVEGHEESRSGDALCRSVVFDGDFEIKVCIRRDGMVR